MLNNELNDIKDVVRHPNQVGVTARFSLELF